MCRLLFHRTPPTSFGIEPAVRSVAHLNDDIIIGNALKEYNRRVVLPDAKKRSVNFGNLIDSSHDGRIEPGGG